MDEVGALGEVMNDPPAAQKDKGLLKMQGDRKQNQMGEEGLQEEDKRKGSSEDEV
jgi:hypothetical protein